ncbi:Mad20 [Actinomadura verrucosospora]|uniref:Mad20 n=1 Tax=Actinomadura verrucosospora TaxID=46165 RepID=A0A7D4AJG6_ACTVE|nr:Mad20 [Actinomadura verrucosospora]
MTRNGRYYVKRNDASTPQLVPLFITISGVTGVAQPDFDDLEHSAGTAWATTDFGGPGRLMISNGVWEPNSSTFQGIIDLSKGPAISFNPTLPTDLWMVMADGSIWTTPDGQTRLRKGDMGGSSATRVAADYTSFVAWAVSSDGRAWVWQKDVTSPPPPHPSPPPPPPPPTPGVQAPSLQVTSTGSGQSTVYKMTGSGFVPDAQVHIRAVEIIDGQATEIFRLTTADSAGHMAFDLAVPCQSGETFSFSANDGRVQSGDFTQTLWSNTVTLQCP